MKKLLIVAFHFPPMGGSSGGLRSLKFAQYLPEHGWEPTILTVNPRVYDHLDPTGLDVVPDSLRIIRAFALDTKKHMSVRSRYPGFLAKPDRWVSWSIGAIPAGLHAIRRHRFDAILSTYPIASAVLIALALNRVSGLPWIADFRDPMTEEGYPRDPAIRRAHEWLERHAMNRATRVIYTTNATYRDQVAKYPDLANGKAVVIPNGYDEVDFEHLPAVLPKPSRTPVRLTHGGVIYSQGRDPGPLFHAIQKLSRKGSIVSGDLQIELRGSGLDESLSVKINELGIGDFVKLLPSIAYRASLSDAATANGLLILQGASCDHQIPAKLYEYLRLGRPIFALTTLKGETATLLRQTGGATIADINDSDAIEVALLRFLQEMRAESLRGPDPAIVRNYSRHSQAKQLATCLDDLGINSTNR
ncbi:MAG: glycosyltransferase [Gammaproteobacteria bacterium]|nr:glycosyltransferase [Gammaproteobacteria bacterium]MDH5239210.1 glycosyltransferase [Gammaproteobacteria bacterium]MDH5259924.1 glycosyltransferase [Gammaproteobacteria bacterium]